MPAGRRLPRRRLQARPDRAAAPRGRRRRREERRDRGRLDRREGDARPLHAHRRRALPRLRLLLARRLHHAGAQRASCADRARARSTAARSRRSATAARPSRAPSRPRPRNPSERRAARWYRLRGYRILDTNCWLAGYELDLVARRGRTLVFCEVKSKAGTRFGDPLEMVTPEKVAPRPPRRRGAGSRRTPSSASLDVRFDVIAERAGRIERRAGRVLSEERHDVEPSCMGATQEQLYAGLDLDLSWSERDLPRARADEARPPPPSVPRQVHPAARRGALPPPRARRAGACSIRSPARGRRSCRRSRAGSTRPASTSRRSTAC